MKKIIILSLILTVFSSTPIAAESAKPKGGITISPASQEIILKQDQPSLNGSFTITNNNDSPQIFEITTIDMGALDDTGGLVFSGLSQDYQRKYGLAEWLELARTRVDIQPRSKETVAFTIRNDASLSPGGHYGALVVRRVGDQTARSDQRVALSPQAASLVFLRKVGGETYGLSLPHITANNSIWRLPTTVSLPFKNEGNVHVVPRGIVRLKNTFGKEIARGIINPDSSLVLPERTRNLSVALTSEFRTIWPGRYTIEVEYRYDGQEQVTRRSKTFYTANLRILLLMLAAFVAVCLVLYKFRHVIKRVFHKLGRIAAEIRSKMRR